MTDRMECLLDDCLTVHLKEIRKICKDKTNNQVMCKSNITENIVKRKAFLHSRVR